MYKVVLNRDPNPWIHNRLHRRDYARFSHNHSQEVIRHANDHRYSRARGNTRAWVEPEHARNRDKDRNKSKDSHRSNSRRDQKDRSYAKPPANQNRSGQSGRSSQSNTEKERSRSTRK
jgi:hypothetical protein